MTTKIPYRWSIHFGRGKAPDWPYGKAGLIVLMWAPVHEKPEDSPYSWVIHFFPARSHWHWPWQDRYIGYGFYEFGFGPLFLCMWG